MAKLKTKKELKRQEQIDKEMQAPVRKDAVYLICGLVSLAIAIYTLIALISYIFTWAQDQSVLSDNDLFSSLQGVENGGGKIGWWWANLLVSKLFGLGAYIIPFFFGGVALFCLKIKKVHLLKLFFISVFGCILISVLFSFIFSFTKVDTLFGTSAGGSYGYYVNQWLKSMIGSVGTAAILIIALIGWLIIINKSFVSKFSNAITAAGSKVVGGADGETAPEDSFEVNEGEEVADDVNFDLEENPDDALQKEIDDYYDTQEETESEEDPQVLENEDVELEVKGENSDDGNSLLGEYTEEELQRTFDPRLELSYYEAPTLDLLESYSNKWYKVSAEELERNKNKIVNTLSNYKIGVSKVSARIGPTVTLYEVVPAPGVRVSQIKRLEEDIQLSLSAKGVRVVTLPGTNAIGIEVANERASVVSMLSCLEYLQTKMKEEGSRESSFELPVAIGKTIKNEIFTFDLTKMPHLLVAGATGQGKSVGLNAIITSLLYTKHPSELKIVMVDPKKVELSLYSKLEKHFLAMSPVASDPVITETDQVVTTLRSLCVEMDDRYALLKEAGVRNIKEYNNRFLQRKLSPRKGHRFMPYIVVIMDEYSDLIIRAGKDVEIPLTRLAQLARAIGIHLVIATQRPTATVITGNIKANFPARIAFMVRSSIDSRAILDESGANQLIGRGDMLFSNGSDLERIQCAFIDTEEVERVVDYISRQQGYGGAMLLPEVKEEESGGDGSEGRVLGEADLSHRDEMFDDAAHLIVVNGSGSASFLQRKLNLGYNRASRVIDQLEKAGIIGPADGSKPRVSLVPDLITLAEKLEEIKNTYGV